MNFFIPSPESSSEENQLSPLSSPIQTEGESHTRIKGKRSSSSSEENLENKKKRTNAEKGYEVCGHANKFKKPCQRVGVCPFHHKMGVNAALDDRAIARRLKRESKKLKKEQASNNTDHAVAPIVKEDFEALKPSNMNVNLLFPMKDNEDLFISELWMQTAAFMNDVPPTTESDFKDFKDPFEGLYPPYSFSVPAFNYGIHSQIA